MALIKEMYEPLHASLVNQGYTPEQAWEIVKGMFGDTSETN
jgi:hypothetical protein